jgi:uncharacterized damage-inducible protein DinB
MNKRDLVGQLQEARAALLRAIDGLSPDAMLRPGVVGLWSVKDVLAHLTAWESELCTALAKLEQAQIVPQIVLIDDIDEWNQEHYAEFASRPLDLVLEDFHGVHRMLLRLIDETDERTLTDVRKFRWMEGEPLTYLITENALWHEQEHTEEIAAWRTENQL